MLAEGYANYYLGVGNLALHSLAQSYGRRARKVAEAMNSPSAMAYVLMITGICDIGVARWKGAQDALEEAIEISGRLGDWRTLGDCLNLLSLTAYYPGDFDFIAKLGADIYALAVRHDNLQQQPWGLNLQGMHHLQVGRIDQAITYLQTAWELLSQSTDRVTKILNRGVLAVTHLREGNYQLALQMAETVVHLIDHS